MSFPSYTKSGLKRTSSSELSLMYETSLSPIKVNLRFISLPVSTTSLAPPSDSVTETRYPIHSYLLQAVRRSSARTLPAWYWNCEFLHLNNRIDTNALKWMSFSYNCEGPHVLVKTLKPNAHQAPYLLCCQPTLMLLNFASSRHSDVLCDVTRTITFRTSSGILFSRLSADIPTN